MDSQRAHIKRDIKFIFILAILLTHFSPLLSTAEGTGRISGVVYNASHQPLAGVEVRAIANSGTYFQKIGYSGADGSYVIENLPVGQYCIRVQNKLGYLNTYYDNVLNKEEATFIKVYDDQDITDINFYLQRGGFISGTIFDENGNRITSSSSIGFFDAKTYASYGFINGKADGSYISPALPDGFHIIKASSLPAGYVISYFDNVSTQDSAQSVYVTANDTIRNIDFYLQQGGAISGYVLAEEGGASPVPDAWIVVTNWDNGEWSSEARTNESGYYCAAGLRPGKYRVYIYSVDPLRYHNEYYQDVAQYENATPVKVVKRDTTRGINFRLKSVKREILSNNFIEIAVSDRYPGSNLTIGITGGLPDSPYDDDKQILFGHPYPYSSFTTLLIDGKEVVFGSGQGTLVDAPYISRDQKSIGRRWDYQNIEIKQKITLSVSSWSETKYEDTAQIQYIITNNDNTAHEIGVRMLFDTMLGSNDAVPVRTSNHTYTGFEQDFVAPNIPSWWTAIEGAENKTFFSVQGTITGAGATPPDRFAIVNWSNIFKTKWRYQVNPNVKIVCTYVGLGEMYPDKEPPYTANHVPAKGASNVSRDTDISLEILDDYMGVDTTSIVMKVNGAKVSPRITGTLQHYKLRYSPPEDFAYNDTVNVSLAVSDLGIRPNIMIPEFYQFYIERDTLAPFILDLYPEPGSRNVAADTCLSFILGDSASGVNKDSVQIFVNNALISPQWQGTPESYSVRYVFQPPFDEMDSVTVRVVAIDQVSPPNRLDSTFYFVVARDSMAPRVESYYPPHGATEVPLDTSIFIELVDDFTGVDLQSIQFYFNKQKTEPVISGDSSRYLIEYGPEDGFRYNQQIDVVLHARDMAKQANVMKPFAFSFQTESDTIPPAIRLLTPANGDTSVIPSPVISCEIQDQKAGIDTASIIMLVNGLAVNYELSGNHHRYVISCPCDTPFDYQQWVSVAVFARDRSNPPNASDTSRYHFRIMREKDQTPPYTTLFQPPKGARDVPPDCVVSFHVKDDLSGVDSSSIKLKVNGFEVVPHIAGAVHDYYVEYVPPLPFDYGQQVILEIDARDLARDSANVMKTDTCFFTIMQDTAPPVVVWQEPGKPGEHIPLESEFVADIIDSLTGVDQNSLRFKFQGKSITPQVDKEGKDYSIRYRPLEPLKYNQQIEFIITGRDYATPPNWIQDSVFVFYTTEDREPPYITQRNPAKDQQDVNFDTDIQIGLKDDIAGVDIESIRLFVDNELVTPDIAGSGNEIILSYTPGTIFRPGQKVNVTVEAADRSNPPNPMNRESYSFTIKKVYPDIYIKSFTIKPAKIMVHKPVQLEVNIGIGAVPVIDPVEFHILDNDVVRVDSALAPGDTVIRRSLDFDRKGKHSLKFVVDPRNQIQESDEKNNSLGRVVEVIEGEITVRSNPFTPNGDGINDDVTFNFEKLGVVNPILKLFDVSGRMIATLRDRSGYKFVWDGRDRFGNPAQPGVYLYVLQDQDKTIANGYVVLAR